MGLVWQGAVGKRAMNSRPLEGYLTPAREYGFGRFRKYCKRDPPRVCLSVIGRYMNGLYKGNPAWSLPNIVLSTVRAPQMIECFRVKSLIECYGQLAIGATSICGKFNKTM